MKTNYGNEDVKMNASILDTNLGRIEYTSVGKGIPVLFLHGGHSNCHEKLSHKGIDLGRFQLITPSRPGYGKTPLGENRSPYQTADLIAELLKHLDLKEVVVYGVSAGWLTAIALASHHPDRVGKLILASAVSQNWLDKKDKIYKSAKIIFHPLVEKLTWGMVRFFSKLFPKLIANSFYPQFSTRPMTKLKGEDVKELISSLNKYNSGRGFVNDIDQEMDDNTLSKVACPTLIIHSKNDKSVGLDHALHARNRIANSKLLELDNEWGHLFWIGRDSAYPIEQTITFIEKQIEDR